MGDRLVGCTSMFKHTDSSKSRKWGSRSGSHDFWTIPYSFMQQISNEVKQSFSSSLSRAWPSLCLYICDTWKSYKTKTVTWLIYECLIALEWVKTNRMHKTILYHFLSHFFFLKILWKLYENIWTRWGWAGPSSAQTGIRELGIS